MPDEPLLAFSDAWAAAWAAHLDASEAYRQAAADWEGAVVLEMAEPGAEPEAAVYLDLWHGGCRVGRVATAEDLARARYVLRGTRAAWRQVLIGGLSPVMAVLTGKLRLVRGDLTALLPYAAAARELLAAAGTIATRFPDD